MNIHGKIAALKKEIHEALVAKVREYGGQIGIGRSLDGVVFTTLDLDANGKLVCGTSIVPENIVWESIDEDNGLLFFFAKHAL